MATHEIPIIGHNSKPDGSGLVWQEPFSVDATNDKWDVLTYVFETPGSTRNDLYGSFIVPQNYVGSPVFNVYWSCPGSGARSGNTDVEWDVDYRCVQPDNTESVDQSGQDESLNTNDTDSDTANVLNKATLSATAGNFAAGDLCQFLLARDGGDAGDTLNDKIQLWAFTFSYSDA